MNPRLSRLQPYPFERLRQWFAEVTPNPALAPIRLSIGEPQHPTPSLIAEALAAGVRGLANYPTTMGVPALREAIAGWLVRRLARRRRTLLRQLARRASCAARGRLVGVARALSPASPFAGPAP